MRKTLFLLMLAMIPTIFMIGQDLNNDHISVNEKIQSKAEKILLDNEMLNGHELQDLKLYTARETNSGYNFIFHHYINDFLVENDEVKLMMDFDFNVRWSQVELSTIQLNDFSSMPEAKAIEIVNNHEYVTAPEIISVEKVIARVGGKDNWDTYYRIDLKDSSERVRLRYYISMEDGSIAAIFDLYTAKAYVNNIKGKITTGSVISSVCCDSAEESGRYHVIDPITTPICSDYVVDYHNDGTNPYVLGSSSDVVTFDDNSPPIGNSDGIFCYDFDTQDYNKLHSYIYTKELLASGIGDSPSTVVLDVDVDGAGNPFVNGDMGTITFGSAPAFNDMAADRFHVAHGFFQLVAKNRVSGLGITTSGGTGSIDYLVMNHYGLDENCYAFGGTDSSGLGPLGQRRTDHTLYSDAINENGIQSSDEAQAWSSYLMRIDTGLGSIAGVGESDTDKLLFDIIDMLGSDIEQNIELLFQTAKTATYIDFEELCRIYKITNDYMDGVSGFSITLDDLPDLYIKDSTVDTGNEPYWLGQMWTSPSIWNTVGSPNGPIGNPETGSTNYIHVLVHDANGIPVENKYLHVYFTMASMGLTWPDDWMEDFSSGQQVSGEMTPAQSIGGAGEYVFSWNPPDPSELDIGDKHHVCIYARITDEHNTVRNSHCDLEGSQVGWNTNVFNSIAWKNLSILDTNGFTGGGGTGSTEEEVSVFVTNTNPPEWYEDEDVPEEIDLFTITLEINPAPENPNILEFGQPDPDFFKKCELYLELDPKFGIPINEGLNGQGFEDVKDGKIHVTGRDFKIEGITLEPEEKYLLTTIYKPLKKAPISFSWVLKNYKGEVVGGELYQSTFSKKPVSNQDDFDIPKDGIQNRSDKNKIKVTPNPSYGLANISTTKEFLALDIVDSRGFLIERITFDKNGVNNYTVNLEGQLTGIYTIRISYKDGTMDSVNLIKK